MTRREALIELRDKVKAGERFIAKAAIAAGFTEFQANRAERANWDESTRADLLRDIEKETDHDQT
jgi:hypothetical protein